MCGTNAKAKDKGLCLKANKCRIYVCAVQREFKCKYRD